MSADGIRNFVRSREQMAHVCCERANEFLDVLVYAI